MPVRHTSPVETGTPAQVFPASPAVKWRTFDVAPDGRFLAIVIQSLAGDRPLTVRTNWASGLAR